MKLGEKYVGFDRSAEVVRQVIDTYFDGDGMRYAKAYYEALAELPSYGNFDIIGHFDLISKHSENVKFFDENATEYQNAVLEAADALRGKIPLFEVNTGAISRGLRTAPYPAINLLHLLKKKEAKLILSSDSHSAKTLFFAFDEARLLLKEVGFTHTYALLDGEFKKVQL